MPEVLDDAAAIESPIEELPAAAVLTRELLTAPLGRTLLWLAAPVLAEQFLNLLVGLVDTYLAGTISKDATVAIGLATQVDWLIGLLFGFIGVGATALVSRHAGMGAGRQSNHFANQAIAAAALLGVCGALLVTGLAPLLPRLLGWEPEPARIAAHFLRVAAWGYVLYSITMIGGACWRGMGDTRTSLYVMSVVNAFNVVVSSSLRFGWWPAPALGVNGIATGTMLARTLGGLLVLMLLLRGRSGLRLHGREMRFRSESMRRLLWVGIPAGIDGMLLWIGHFGFLMIISRLASGADQAATVAAHVVGIRIEAFSYLPAFAWAVAASALVGQSLGAGDLRRARHSGHLAAVQGAAMCLVMGVLYFIFAPQIYAHFNQNEDVARVAAIGVPALRLEAFFQVPLALMIIYTNALRGAGDTRWPLVFTVIGMTLVRVPVAYLGGIVLSGGLVGAWVGMCADMTARATLSAVRFARGKWQRVNV